MVKRFKFILCVGLCLYSLMASAGTNLQLFYDFGSMGTACANQRSPRITTTLELFYPDPWGNTFAFVDLDYAIHPNDPKHTPFMAYAEIARCLNFWQKTAAKDLSVQVEYNGGLGVYQAGKEVRGYAINHAALVGLNYCLHTADYKNIFNLGCSTNILWTIITSSAIPYRCSSPLYGAATISARRRVCASPVSWIYGDRRWQTGSRSY